MQEKPFLFADFVDEFRVEFTVYDQVDGHYNNEGRWIDGSETPRTIGGIILPLNNDELQREANGTYTRKDRKVYVTEPLKEGQRIVKDGQEFTIDQEKPYQDYADVFIYFAKGVG